MSIRAISRELQLNRKTVDRLIENNMLPHYKERSSSTRADPCEPFRDRINAITIRRNFLIEHQMAAAMPPLANQLDCQIPHHLSCSLSELAFSLPLVNLGYIGIRHSAENFLKRLLSAISRSICRFKDTNLFNIETHSGSRIPTWVLAWIRLLEKLSPRFDPVSITKLIP